MTVLMTRPRGKVSGRENVARSNGCMLRPRTRIAVAGWVDGLRSKERRHAARRTQRAGSAGYIAHDGRSIDAASQRVRLERASLALRIRGARAQCSTEDVDVENDAVAPPARRGAAAAAAALLLLR